MFYSDIFANRPAAGVVGRIFISTDTYEFYRDTGSAWDLIGGTGTGTITGSGTIGTLSKFTSSSSIGDSIVSEIGSALTINGTGKATNWYVGNPTDTTRSFAAAGNANDIALWLEEYTSSGGGTPDIFFRNGRGTISSKSNIQVGDSLGGIAWAGYLGSTFSDSATFSTTITNIDLVNNHADTDIILYQSYNSPSLRETLRVRASNGNVVAPNGSFENTLTKTAISTEGWYGLASVENITIPANTSFSNLGFSLGSFIGANLMTYQGNATFANGNGTTSVFGTNGFGFSNAGSTITINQRSGGINAYSGLTAFNYTTGTTNGTITHLAGLHVLAPYQTSSAILQVNNYYGALINASNERTAFTITNRWGIYQEGSLDKNYFAANVILGSTTDNGFRFQLTGDAKIFTDSQKNILIQNAQHSTLTGITSAITFSRLDGISSLSAIFGSNDGGIAIAGRAGIFFATGGGSTYNNTIQRMVIDENIGNLGLSFTPLNTYTDSVSIEMGASATFWTEKSSSIYNSLGIGVNFYYDSAGNVKYKNSNSYPSRLSQYQGNFLFDNAPTGTANTAITFTTRLKLTDTGNLLIGSIIDPGQKLYLNGSLRIDGQSSGTAGGSSGQHLIINLDGTTYKIALLNP